MHEYMCDSAQPPENTTKMNNPTVSILHINKCYSSMESWQSAKQDPKIDEWILKQATQT